MVVYVTDVALCIAYVKNYIWGFYFWFDMISTSVIIFEFIITILAQNGIYLIPLTYLQGTKIAKAARASKFGTKTAKIYRYL